MLTFLLSLLAGITGSLPVIGGSTASKAVVIGLLAASALMVAGTISKELSILKWVGIALAVLSTVFTLVIVGSHLSGRLIGLGKIGIIGTVGAELMAIICAWLATSERKRVAGVAMICQIVLTAVLLINASIALDMDWQETLANKAAERTLVAQKAVAEEQRKTIEKQAEVTGQLIAKQGEIAGQLAQTDKRLAREFVRTGKAATTALLPKTDPTPAPPAPVAAEAAPLDISKMTIYERYGLTVVPLFLGLLTVIALGLAAHSGDNSTVYAGESYQEPATRQPVGFTSSQAQQMANDNRSARVNSSAPPAPFRRRPGRAGLGK
jgi:hypothetical protein